MKKIKNFDEFNAIGVNESFTITLDELPSIGDIVDKVDWNEDDKIAFIDFKGIKNIPVQITDGNSGGGETVVDEA